MKIAKNRHDPGGVSANHYSSLIARSGVPVSLRHCVSLQALAEFIMTGIAEDQEFARKNPNPSFVIKFGQPRWLAILLSASAYSIFLINASSTTLHQVLSHDVET